MHQRRLSSLMHVLTILAFALLFWRGERPLPWTLIDDARLTLAFVVMQPVLIGLVSAWSTRRARRRLQRCANVPESLQRSHHRVMLALRVAALLGLGVAIFLTPWPEWFAFRRVTPALQIVGDLIVLSPFVLSLVALWLGAFPLERELRMRSLGAAPWRVGDTVRPWGLRTYLAFNLRHHVLVTAVPMMLILLAADLTRGYERSLQSLGGSNRTPDVLLGVAVVAVFLLSPLMICRIWHTAPLEDGALRDSLQSICNRIGLRCRDILVWHSDGMMINAAVVGLVAPLRYVLLSDGLLETMDRRQIEAVFGHEAGHVRRRHIPYFLLFALVGWLFVSGVMELTARLSAADGSAAPLSPWMVDGISAVALLVVWGLGFGWVSRRFEREADLFGAACVAPDAAGCTLPCSVHLDDQPHGTRDPALSSRSGRVCASGATVFASALDRVAVLNGIPHDERSWRHSSIGSRIRFLISLADDPTRAGRFVRLLRRVKVAMLCATAVGLAVMAYYSTKPGGLMLLR
ncbi:MAG: M48 family metallopeptidase [Phycisphaerae bacterium]